jgi:outer membrane biogenesis lipoprotein LolB
MKMEKRARIAICLVAISMLSACAGPSTYSKADLDQQQFAADQSQCNAQANTARLGTNGFAGAAVFKQNKDMCMVGKGYTTMCNGTPCDPQY